MVTLEQAEDIIRDFGYEPIEGRPHHFRGTGRSEGEAVSVSEEFGIIDVSWENGEYASYSVTRVDAANVDVDDFHDTFFYIWNYPKTDDIDYHDMAALVKKYGLYVKGRQEDENGYVSVEVHAWDGMSGMCVRVTHDINGNVIATDCANDELTEWLRANGKMATFVNDVVCAMTPLASAVKEAILYHEAVENTSDGNYVLRVKSKKVNKTIVVEDGEAKHISIHDDSHDTSAPGSWTHFEGVTPYFAMDIVDKVFYGF